MNITTRALLTAASITVGLGYTGLSPALAQTTYTTTGDVTVFEAVGGFTQLTTTYDLNDILAGDASAPGGNIELDNGAAGIDFSNPVPNTLTISFDSSRQITFSSLTQQDWFGLSATPDYTADNLSTQWFTAALDAYGDTVRSRFAIAIGATGTEATDILNGAADENIFTAFVANQGFQRISDPNIAYAYETPDGITFGLAAHSDAGSVNPLLTGLYASEVVKVIYDGKTEYKYSFAQPTDSGLTSIDGTNSHEGNYEFAVDYPLDDTPDSSDVPEPSILLGLAGLGSTLLLKRKSEANA